MVSVDGLQLLGSGVLCVVQKGSHLVEIVEQEGNPAEGFQRYFSGPLKAFQGRGGYASQIRERSPASGLYSSQPTGPAEAADSWSNYLTDIPYYIIQNNYIIAYFKYYDMQI